MAIVIERGAVTTMSRGRPGAARPSRFSLTLADLITTIQDVVGPEDDGLVVATVRHLLRAGRLTALGAGIRRGSLSHSEQEMGHRCFVERVSVCKARNGGYPMFGCRRHR